ncbi:hypothetical protein, partial [Anaerotruncus colihominis]|uniref:hypothetical protein n=1 Tax=Anaerotruncus colihominis TaxID=169435 RepID=UPI0026EEEB97
MNYGNAVKGVVENHIKNMDALDSQGKELEQQFRAERITGRTAAEKRQELEGKRAAAIAAAQGEVNRLHQEHDAAVDAWNALDGSKLHADAELLKMDIPMSQVQYQQLCDKHRDSSLMLSLLAQYADRHQDQPLFADRPADEKARKAAFADYCERAIGTCRTHNTLSAALF